MRGSILISFPCSSSGGVISKTCSTEAMLIKREASAKYRPGHILFSIEHRQLDFFGSRFEEACSPPPEAKRELVWVAHIRVHFPIAYEPLRPEDVRVFVHVRIV